MKFLVLLSICAAITAQGPKSHGAGHVPQVPPIWDALKDLRGGKDMTVEDQFDLIMDTVPGKDYPINNVVPAATFACTLFKQPGFYADTTEPSLCQAFHRCDENGVDFGFLCPNGTLFNQITLVCDWFFNVDCSRSAKYQDYSNSRLADKNADVLDTQLVLGAPVVPVMVAEVAAAAGRLAKTAKAPAAPRRGVALPVE